MTSVQSAEPVQIHHQLHNLKKKKIHLEIIFFYLSTIFPLTSNLETPSLSQRAASLALFLTPFLAPCVTLGKLTNLSELWFSHLKVTILTSREFFFFFLKYEVLELGT